MQVIHDILGLFETFIPKHTHQYARLGDAMRSAIATYKREVEERRFPTTEHATGMEAELLADL